MLYDVERRSALAARSCVALIYTLSSSIWQTAETCKAWAPFICWTVAGVDGWCVLAYFPGLPGQKRRSIRFVCSVRESLLEFGALAMAGWGCGTSALGFPARLCFPGAAAVVPTVGAALIIAAGT